MYETLNLATDKQKKTEAYKSNQELYDVLETKVDKNLIFAQENEVNKKPQTNNN